MMRDWLVVGAGLTGAQLALALAEKGVEAVTLVSQKPLAISPFDFDPCWLSPKCRGRRWNRSEGPRKHTEPESRANRPRRD